MSDTNLDDVLGNDAEKVETPSTTSKRETKKPKAETAPRVNPIPLAPVQDGLLPGDKGYVYDKAVAALQSEVKDLTDKVNALKAASRQLQSFKAANAVVRTDQQRYDRLKAINDGVQEKKDEKATAVRTVLAEMGLL